MLLDKFIVLSFKITIDTFVDKYLLFFYFDNTEHKAYITQLNTNVTLHENKK